MKKKLLVLLGAGSSIGLGMPSAMELDKKVGDWACEWADENRAVNYYCRLRKNRENYYDAAPPLSREHFKSNYEDFLGDMHALMNGIIPNNCGDPVFQWLRRADVFKDVNFEKSQKDADGTCHFVKVSGQLQTIFKKLAAHMRQACQKLDAESEAFKTYKRFFQKLDQEFDLGIYSLNYDTAAYSALPDFFTGFSFSSLSDGHFAPSEIHRHTAWRFIYHLHGSVHHHLEQGNNHADSPEFGWRIVWKRDLADVAVRSYVLLTTATDNKRMLQTTLVAGRWKLEQIQQDPFLTFYSTLPRHVHEADAILICGYGFGDEHVNNALKTMLYARRKRRPPVLVVDSDCPRRTLARRIDEWPRRLAQTLRVGNLRFRDPQHRCEKNWLKLPETLKNGQFEFLYGDKNCPVAVFCGGMEGVCAEPTQTINFLKTGIS